MSEARHAYLIIAHNQFELLQTLIACLDDARNDIFIHLDSKAGDVETAPFYAQAKKSGLHFVENRVDVRWGAFSLVECELRLLEAALPGKYAYYHLMSGVDLPLKSQTEIHRYFEAHEGREFVHFEAPVLDKKSYRRVAKYNFFGSRNKSIWEKVAYRVLMFLELPIDRTRRSGLTYQKGAQWFSITHALASYIASQRAKIEKQFKYTLCGDEMFLQTLVASSDFIKQVSPENFCNNYATVRYCIDWQRGNPYEYRLSDYDELMASGMHFARKFNWNADKEIVLKIKETVTRKAE